MIPKIESTTRIHDKRKRDRDLDRRRNKKKNCPGSCPESQEKNH